MSDKMIIFDMDGTLWDTVDATTEASRKVALKYDDVKDITKETVSSAMGFGFEEVARRYMPYLKKERREEVLHEITNELLKILKEKGAKLYDGVSEVIRNLSKKYKLGIVTNNNDEYAKTLIDFYGLNDYFTDYKGASSIGKTKAETIEIMLEENNVFSGVYVGDTKLDMESALDNGLTFVYARYGFGSEVETKYYIESFYELEDVLDTI